MKNILKFGLYTLAIVLIGTAFTSSDEVLGHESSSIVWTGTKVTGEHTGTLEFKTVSWTFDEAGALTSANFIVDMTTIKNTDLDEEYATKLVGHLNSADFFNTAVYPTAQFKTTSVKSAGDGEYEITGDMTIKDITKPLSFSANVSDDGHMKHGTATVIIDRAEYDVRYGSGSFFDGLGDKMISDEFTLAIDIKKH